MQTLQNIGLQAAYNLGVVVAGQAVGIDDYVSKGNLPLSSLKGGLYVTASNEVVRQLTTGTNNVSAMNYNALLDDVCFNGLGILSINALSLGSTLDDFIPNIGSRQAQAAVTDALIFTALQQTGNLINNSATFTPVRHFATWIQNTV